MAGKIIFKCVAQPILYCHVVVEGQQSPIDSLRHKILLQSISKNQGNWPDQEVEVVSMRYNFMAAVRAVHMVRQLDHRASLVQIKRVGDERAMLIWSAVQLAIH